MKNNNNNNNDKATEHEGDCDTNCNWCAQNNPKKLDKALEEVKISGRAETIQTTALLRSARILRRVLETCDLLSLRLQ